MKNIGNISRMVLVTSLAFMAALSPLDVRSDTPVMSIRTEAIQFTRVQYDNGEVYDGDIKNGKRNGYGTYEWNNGRVYTGYWKNKKPSVPELRLSVAYSY